MLCSEIAKLMALEVATSTTDFIVGFKTVKHIDLVTGTSVKVISKTGAIILQGFREQAEAKM